MQLSEYPLNLAQLIAIRTLQSPRNNKHDASFNVRNRIKASNLYHSVWKERKENYDSRYYTPNSRRGLDRYTNIANTAAVKQDTQGKENTQKITAFAENATEIIETVTKKDEDTRIRRGNTRIKSGDVRISHGVYLAATKLFK